MHKYGSVSGSVSLKTVVVMSFVCLAMASLPVMAQNLFPSAGNAGINTTNPQRLLHIAGSPPTLLFQDNLRLRTAVAIESIFSFRDSSLTEYAWVGDGSPSVNTLTMYAGPSHGLTLFSGGIEVFTSPAGSGNVGIGVANPTSKLHVAGNIVATGSVAATYQDVAEWVPSTEDLTAGTLVSIDASASNHVRASTSAYDTSVAGVVSAQPGLILGVAGTSKAMIATTGRVKVRVDATSAPIAIGDLLVSSDRSGVAMKSEPLKVGGRAMHQPGTIFGKALEPLNSGVGEILVLLTLQ